MEIEITEQDLAEEDDPFLLMGYGINAFFDLVLHLMKLCFVLSLFSAPMLFAFSGYGFEGVSIKGLK